ncbi:MAG: hypothetical protein GFH27_549305n133 [Chloroflexi bacterium AL-W]|nr:hypothetical protein [Chloroflexi bacterium AL-N1]NOK69379.1 hypothetical protein [Chloroflexi bacterium AL-N10]NOK76440.1 hypothetical protein [Chloroflexi bacterium AL-N5]NOK83557.1 hypothetical protein [Chloroflexi bacterium AL-W]NOK91217.1 hypothetical protein [Chloroflexi bacterium AL-N15]
MKCPYCTSDVPEKYNFCLTCQRQVKCLNCKESLLPEKNKCFVCGIVIGASQSSQTPMNEFTLEEKQTRTSAYRKINGRLSDNAIGEAATLFSGLYRHRKNLCHCHFLKLQK